MPERRQLEPKGVKEEVEKRDRDEEGDLMNRTMSAMHMRAVIARKLSGHPLGGTSGARPSEKPCVTSEKLEVFFEGGRASETPRRLLGRPAPSAFAPGRAADYLPSPRATLPARTFFQLGLTHSGPCPAWWSSLPDIRHRDLFTNVSPQRSRDLPLDQLLGIVV